MKQTFLALLMLVSACSRQPEQPSTAAQTEKMVEPGGTALDFYDVSLNTDNVKPGQQISFCFKARNAVTVTGSPGKFFKKGALDGDCLVDAPQADTMYRIEVTGSDGTKRSQTAFVKVRN